jgi:hypothetical protein|tara:strand:- start:196 stop:513 length:318 start_codon:yes stop_codon:yes gene_type:complete
MSHQNLKPEDALNITLLLAHARCMSELLHTLPQHKFQFKAYFKKLFDVVKEYEEGLNKLTNYNEGEESSKEQQEIYDLLMDLTYDVRDQVIKKTKDGNRDIGPNN